jgi:RNase P subunit RPR2
MISQDEKQKIAQRLGDKLKDIICPMCHQDNFIIADGYFNNVIQDNLDGLVLGGPTIPTVSIICANCGFVSQHALGVLGFLPVKNVKNKEKKDNDEQTR